MSRATRGSRGRVLKERQDLGHMPLLAFMYGVLWGSRAEAGLVSSHQKDQDLVELQGSLIKGVHP